MNFVSSKKKKKQERDQELAERNPIMAKVYDNFVNTSLNYKGKTLKSEAKKNTKLATSSGLPNFDIGILDK